MDQLENVVNVDLLGPQELLVLLDVLERADSVDHVDLPEKEVNLEKSEGLAASDHQVYLVNEGQLESLGPPEQRDAKENVVHVVNKALEENQVS